MSLLCLPFDALHTLSHTRCNPTRFISPVLYRSAEEQVPVGDYEIPLGKVMDDAMDPALFFFPPLPAGTPLSSPDLLILAHGRLDSCGLDPT